MMQSTGKDISSLIDNIAGIVLMLDQDDIQSLGEILQHLDELKDPQITDYTDQVRNIVERLILDEYESAQVGIDELNASVEQLQLAAQSVWRSSKSRAPALHIQVPLCIVGPFLIMR